MAEAPPGYYYKTYKDSQGVTYSDLTLIDPIAQAEAEAQRIKQNEEYARIAAENKIKMDEESKRQQILAGLENARKKAGLSSKVIPETVVLKTQFDDGSWYYYDYYGNQITEQQYNQQFNAVEEYKAKIAEQERQAKAQQAVKPTQEQFMSSWMSSHPGGTSGQLLDALRDAGYQSTQGVNVVRSPEYSSNQAATVPKVEAQVIKPASYLDSIKKTIGQAVGTLVGTAQAVIQPKRADEVTTTTEYDLTKSSQSFTSGLTSGIQAGQVGATEVSTGIYKGAIAPVIGTITQVGKNIDTSINKGLGTLTEVYIPFLQPLEKTTEIIKEYTPAPIKEAVSDTGLFFKSAGESIYKGAELGIEQAKQKAAEASVRDTLAGNLEALGYSTIGSTIGATKGIIIDLPIAFLGAPAVTAASLITNPVTMLKKTPEYIQEAIANPFVSTGSLIGTGLALVGTAGLSNAIPKLIKNVKVSIGSKFVAPENVFFKSTLEDKGFPLTKSTEETLARFDKTALTNDKVGAIGQTSTTFTPKKSDISIAGGRAKSGLEDPGIYITPKGEGSPYFLGIEQSGKYTLNLNPFESVKNAITKIFEKANTPNVVTFELKGVNKLPREVVEVPGFSGVQSFFKSGKAEPGVAYITKRSEIGQGELVPKKFYNEQFINQKTGKVQPKLMKEGGTSEIEAVIPENTKILQKPLTSLIPKIKGYEEYTTYKGVNVPIRKYTAIPEEVGIISKDTGKVASESLFKKTYKEAKQYAEDSKYLSDYVSKINEVKISPLSTLYDPTQSLKPSIFSVSDSTTSPILTSSSLTKKSSIENIPLISSKVQYTQSEKSSISKISSVPNQISALSYLQESYDPNVAKSLYSSTISSPEEGSIVSYSPSKEVATSYYSPVTSTSEVIYVPSKVSTTSYPTYPKLTYPINSYPKYSKSTSNIIPYSTSYSPYNYKKESYSLYPPYYKEEGKSKAISKKKKSIKKASAFIVQTRRQGKWLDIGRSATILGAAARGKEVVTKTLARSFRIVEGKNRNIVPFSLGESMMFRSAKRSPYVTVQRSPFSLSARSEVAEIQAARSFSATRKPGNAFRINVRPKAAFRQSRMNKLPSSFKSRPINLLNNNQRVNRSSFLRPSIRRKNSKLLW